MLAYPRWYHTSHCSLFALSDERDAIQKKTFTKWINNHLRKAGGHVSDLFEDLKDGHNLLTLLELLSNEKLPREKGKMRFHMLQNIETSLNFLQKKNVKLVNIRPVDILDGNPKLCLGLIWTIILHFQVSMKTFYSLNGRALAWVMYGSSCFVIVLSYTTMISIEGLHLIFTSCYNICWTTFCFSSLFWR